MQVVRGDSEVVIRGRGNMEFAPQRVNILLLVVDAGIFHHVVACGGVGAVGTDKKVKFHFDLRCSLVRRIRRLSRVLGMVGFGKAPLEPGDAFGEVGASELVVEEECYVGHGFEGVE